MSDSEDNITPFRLPEAPAEPAGETFGERLRRRRIELEESEKPEEKPGWQSRTRHLVAYILESPHATAVIARKNADEARSVDGVERILFAEDLPPFRNSLGNDFSGEPLLAEDEVYYVGQPVALIVAKDLATCRFAAAKIEVEYHSDTAILTLEQALALESFHGEPRKCSRGDAKKELGKCPQTLSGHFSIAPQEVIPNPGIRIEIRPESGGSALSVAAASILPTAVRSAVAKAADLPESGIHLSPIGLPGLSGALETKPVRLAALLTHAVMKCRCAVTLHVSNSPLLAGKRHETRAAFDVGFRKDGKILVTDLRLALDGGWFVNDSTNALDRAILHGDAVYGIPHLQLTARLCRTNQSITSNLPAEGAAQATWAMEEIIRRVANATGLSPAKVREKNFYGEEEDLKTTPYGQPVNASSIHRVWHQVLRRSDCAERAREIRKWNLRNSSFKRGIGICPLKFGIGDPRAERNAAAVIVQILGDGSVTARVGLVDLNDGFDAQIREEVANHLGVEESTVHVVLNDFEALPRATPVLGTDASGLVLRALAGACRSLQSRLREVALQLFAARGQTEIELEAIRFQRGFVGSDIAPGNPLLFKEVIEGAWRKRVNLIETGYHRTPNLWWDPELGAGWPFTSFTYAAAVTEIQIDLFTGELELLRVDIAHEGSPSANQGDRDFAQLMRAFTLGTDWLLSESVDPDAPGGPTPEAFPGFADAPFEVVTDRLRPLGDPLTIAGDPCSEAPVILAGSIREALCHALSSTGNDADIDLLCPFPASPPRVISALREISKRSQKAASKKTGG